LLFDRVKRLEIPILVHQKTAESLFFFDYFVALIAKFGIKTKGNLQPITSTLKIPIYKEIKS